MILPAEFYHRPVLQTARSLLGMRLVRLVDGQRLSGIITETEAYDGEQDQACHARSGKSKRNAVMYNSGGCAYVYFTYGMHWMLNAVCGAEGYPAAVLIRAIQPSEGLDVIASHRVGRPRSQWTDGPAKLTQALSITGSLNGTPLTDPTSPLFIESGDPIPDERVRMTARVGLGATPEPWLSLPWRFVVKPA